MEEQIPLVFYSSKNYKSGQYILNNYKAKDFILMIVFIILGFLMVMMSFLIMVGNIYINLLISISVAVIPSFIYLPIGDYHNVITLWKIYKDYKMQKRIYKWKGIIYEET